MIYWELLQVNLDANLVIRGSSIFQKLKLRMLCTKSGFIKTHQETL